VAERPDPAHPVEVPPDLPGLEDLLDLLDEPRQLGGELRVPIGGLEEVQERLPDQVADRLVQTKPLPDVPRGLALVDSDLVELHHDRPTLGSEVAPRAAQQNGPERNGMKRCAQLRSRAPEAAWSPVTTSLERRDGRDTSP